MNIYEQCPTISNERFLLRLVAQDDCADLLKVYSDERAVPLFNSDNCHGDDFHYQTMERMAKAIDFWLFSYQNRYFVRWSIIDRQTGECVGTIELFARDDEAGSYTALLRLDLRSDYEKRESLESILSLILEPACTLFECDTVTTKAIPQAEARRQVLRRFGFEESQTTITGDDGTRYGDYYVYRKHA